MIRSIIGGRARQPASDSPGLDPSGPEGPGGPDGPDGAGGQGGQGAPGAGGDGAAARWSAWLQSPPGQYVLDWERAAFDAAVADVFGYHAVQLGLPAVDFLAANRMPHRVRAAMADEPSTLGGAVRQAAPDSSQAPAVLVEHFEELPFETQSLDLVVLPHVLEFATDPHQVLREVDRVLRPEGRVIISGFNPVSLWGARQFGLRGVARPFLPEAGQFIGVPRLRDWFKLLSFELEAGRYGCYRPPCRTQLWLDRTAFMEKAGDRWWPICGATYLLSAVKRVRAMRVIGPAWKKKRSRSAVGAVAPQRRAVRPELRLVSGFGREREDSEPPGSGDGVGRR